RLRFFLFLILLVFALTAFAQDSHCPAYPVSQRDADRVRLKAEKQAQIISVRRKYSAQSQPYQATNYIDDFIFGKMAADGVPWASQSNDAEFLRRISLDLTGRTPSSDQIKQFVQDNASNKRSALIETLMNSEAYTDYWTSFFANHFEVTSGYYNFIGIP